MDSNNSTQAATTPNVPPAAPQPTAPQVQIPDTPSNSNKIILWFVIGLVIIVLVVGGIYFFLSRQQATIQTLQPESTVQVTPKPQDTIDALDRDLNALNIENADSDFASIDQDLQQL